MVYSSKFDVERLYVTVFRGHRRIDVRLITRRDPSPVTFGITSHPGDEVKGRFPRSTSLPNTPLDQGRLTV